MPLPPGQKCQQYRGIQWQTFISAAEGGKLRWSISAVASVSQDRIRLASSWYSSNSNWRSCTPANDNNSNGYLLLLLHLFNGLPSRTTWISRYEKGKISLDLNEARNGGIMGWQWHQLDHMQTICTLLQTEIHINPSSLNFYRLDAPPDVQTTVSNHWRQTVMAITDNISIYCLNAYLEL